MFPFTKQERAVLLSVSCIFLVGTTVQYAYKKNPKLAYYINLVDSEYLYYKIDLNTATVEDLRRIPYIGAATANRIIDHREKNGGYTDIHQVKNVRGINKKNFEKFRKHLKI